MAAHKWGAPIKNELDLNSYQLMRKNDKNNKVPLKRHDEYLKNLPAIQIEENQIKMSKANHQNMNLGNWPIMQNQHRDLGKWHDKQNQRIDQDYWPSKPTIKENLVNWPPTPQSK